MKSSIICTLLLIVSSLWAKELSAQAHPVTKESFAGIGLDFPGLAKVKKAVADAQYKTAANELLQYYRKRNTIKHPQFNADDAKNYVGKKVNEATQQLADDILLHRFKPHKGYPAYDYGQDINWQYRPVKDQLLTTFLHRTAFWEPLGLVYRSTGDEKYAKEWIFELRDWVRKNKQGAYPDDKDYAWKAFVVSFRLNHWSGYFNLFLNSPNFTPEFLMEFLQSYREQASYVMANYTDIGNHRLYEALHLMYAGCIFPEFNEAKTWSNSGIEVLTAEIGKQVLPDGVQFELSPSYHIGSIKIFLDALQLAQMTHQANSFPPAYFDLVEKMTMAVGKFSFPDYSIPLYGNSFSVNTKAMLENYTAWAKVFPKNQTLQYYASAGKAGQKPDGLSTSLPNAGFYAFRNGWDSKATVMQLKAGPPAEFHSHPDNGNFVLWVKGREFTPDAGSFIYANVGGQENAKRDWYRSTKAHQTLTLDNQNISNDAKLEKWETGKDLDVLRYSNPSYAKLSHQRTFLFIDKHYFVIIDRAMGEATGNLGIHFVLKEDAKPLVNANAINTTYTDCNNLLIKCLSPEKTNLKPEESFVSYQYQKEEPRPAFVFETPKPDAQTQGFITLVCPYDGHKPPLVEIKQGEGHNLAKGKINLTITIDGKTSTIKQDL